MSENDKSQTVEVGTFVGDVCARNGCGGVIAETAKGDCSCHISPPCGSCTEPREYCPECDWSAKDDERAFNEHLVRINPNNPNGAWMGWRKRPLDPSKLDYYSGAHVGSDGLASTCSMVKEGVYPEHMTRADVEKVVRGTFGGHFASFGGGRFKYIAYTD